VDQISGIAGFTKAMAAGMIAGMNDVRLAQVGGEIRQVWRKLFERQSGDLRDRG